MPDQPILFVTGLGRCGTTMVMQMLQTAGVPCAGTPPVFEDIPVAPSGVDHHWLGQQAGRAVKWIDPTVTRINHQNSAAIFLSRDPKEQAKSQLKMLGIRDDRNARRAMTKAITRDTRHARALVRKMCGDHFVLSLHFDKILQNPFFATARIASFCDMLGLPFGNLDAALAIIKNRDPACAPDLSAELSMINEEPH